MNKGLTRVVVWGRAGTKGRRSLGSREERQKGSPRRGSRGECGHPRVEVESSRLGRCKTNRCGHSGTGGG